MTRFYCLLLIATTCASAQIFHLPTSNQTLFEPGGEAKFFVGTVGKPWNSGTFGCVRTDGYQLHEGLDIRCLQRDKRGEPTDAVTATTDGLVAYLNHRAGLSSFGQYIILQHQVQGLQIFSMYAHLSKIRPDLRIGKPIRAGEPIGVMGRTAATQQTISKDRAHLHFELDFLINERFAQWYKKAHPGERNDHGLWNGQNLIGIDPRAVLLAQRQQQGKFSLLQHIRQQTELCRVLVRATDFPWVKRYSALVKPNPLTQKEPIAGYEIALNYYGFPFELIPRVASEIKSKAKLQLLSVNAAEQTRNPCGRLLTRKSGHWELTSRARDRLDLLTY